MIAIHVVHFAYRVLKILLVLLILLGVGVLVRFYLENRAAEREYRPYIETLEELYQLRKDAIIEEYDQRIRSAPTEVNALAFQQEKAFKLTETDDLYFSSKRSILRREYGVLQANWPDEMKLLERGGASDE